MPCLHVLRHGQVLTLRTACCAAQELLARQRAELEALAAKTREVAAQLAAKASCAAAAAATEPVSHQVCCTLMRRFLLAVICLVSFQRARRSSATCVSSESCNTSHPLHPMLIDLYKLQAADSC